MLMVENSQKPKGKKAGKRRYKTFIYNVSWWWRGINLELDNSYIYKRVETVKYKHGKTKQIIQLPDLPRWKDVTRVQEVAYFAKFLAETKEFSNLKPFTQDFTYTRHDKYKNKKLSKIKNDYAKKVYNSLRYPPIHIGFKITLYHRFCINRTCFITINLVCYGLNCYFLMGKKESYYIFSFILIY